MADQGWDVVSTSKVGADPWAVTGVTPLGEPEAPLVSPEEMLTPVAGEPTSPIDMAKAVGERLVGGAKYIAGTEPEKRGSLIGDVVSGVERANVGAAGIFRAVAESAAPVLDPITGKILPENPLRRIASEFDRLGKESEARIKARAPTEEQDVISSGVSSGVQSLTQSLMAIPMALLPGGQPAALTMLSTNTGGNAYQEARNKGLSPQQAIPYAVSQASIEYATEVMPLTKLVSDINQKTGFGKLLMNQIVREVPGEQVATILQDMNDWAVLNPEKTAQQYLEERPSAAAQTLVATVVGVGGNVIVGKALQSVVGEEKAPEEAPKIEPKLEPTEGFEVVSQEPIAPVTPVTPVEPEITLPVSEPTPEQITGISAAEFEIPEVTPVTPEAPVTPVTQETATTAPEPVEPPPVQNLTGGLPIQEIPLKDLKVSDEVPQFKIGATKEGVVEPLGGKFERTGVAPIQVWRRTDGSLEVISGRHRLDLAKRSKEKTIPAQIHDEAQGFTRDKAAILDAELNIRDGQGKVKDYVGYFKGSGISRDEADARGLLARAIGKRSYAIAADGSEELITAHRADAVGDEAAYLIALNAPKDASLQAVGIKAIQDGKSASSAVNLMQAVKTLVGERETTTDMFGFDESAMKEAEEMAKIAARKQREIQQRLSVMTGASKNPELARKEGIDVKDPDAVRRRVDELRQAKATWDNWSSSSDLIGQIRAEMGPSEFALKPQTEEDLRAQEEAAAEREAAEIKAIADREVGLFGLQPQVQEMEAPPTGDLFGARALAEQPARKAPEVPVVETGLFAAPKAKVLDITERLEDKAEAEIETGILETEQQRGKAALTKEVNQRVQKALDMANEAIEEGPGITYFEQDITTAEEFVSTVNYVYEGLEKGTLPFAVQSVNRLKQQADDLIQIFEERIKDRQKLESEKLLTEAQYDELRKKEYDERTPEEKAKLFEYEDAFRESPEVERIKQPDDENDIRIRPYKDGYVAAISYLGRKAGRSIPLSPNINDLNPLYPDRKSAIKASAEAIRDLAADSKDRKALLWLGDVIRKEGVSLDRMPKAKPTKEEQAAINRERQVAKKEAAKKPKEAPDLEEKKARILEMAERLITKPGNKVTTQEIEFQGDMYNSQTTVFEGRLYKSEIDDIRSAFGNAKDITLVNEDFRVLTVRLIGKYASDSNAVRVVETVYTPIEGEPTIPLANIPEPGIDQPKVKKLPKGRSPELAALAQQLADGKISKEEYERAVKKFKPIYPYEQPPKPVTYDQAYEALDTGKRDKINPEIPAGTQVGLRLDIPSFNRKGVFVVSIHSKRTPSAAGKAIGYGAVGRIKDVTFGLGKETKALEIAAGEAKDVLQTMEGKWVPSTDAEVVAEINKNFNNPQWTQVGINPERHSYFWDRFTTMPVIAADEVLQIGNFILAKNPVYGKKEDFLYNINSQPPLTTEERASNRKTFRQETIDELRAVSRRKTALVEKIKNYGSDLATQKLLNDLDKQAADLKEWISYKPNVTAEAFLKHARDAVEGSGSFREPVLDADVFAVIQQMYHKTPWALEGLRLSITRRPGDRKGSLGEFAPYQRIVRLWSGTEGVTNPQTVRHEVMHSLEQMMTEPQRRAIIDSYLNALNKAIKANTDKRSQEYFEGVLEFLADPSATKMNKALEKLPSYEFYQFINPSEYWAVNAEKLMKAKLGTAWEKFKKSVRKLYEALKNVFGFDNRYAVHKLFDSIMGEQPQRLTRQTLADYMMPGEYQTTFLSNVQKVDDLLAKQNVPDTPMLATSVVKTKIVNAARDMKDLFKDMIQNPREIPMMAFNGIDYGLTYLRNKNIWFGSGLNAADFARYNGELKTGENLATASLALDNAIRGGNIGIQVIMQGGIKFDDKAKMFVATQTNKGMRQVYEAEARLRDELGAQRATNLIQRYLEAKRSRSIQNEYYDRQAFLEANKEMLADMKADPKADPKEVKEMERAVKQAEDDVKSIEIVMNKVRLTDEEIDEVIAMEKDYPDLKEIIDNFQAVNKNLLKFWRQVGMLSENRYNVLSRIKDYVPWYRIMDDAEDVHSPLQSTTRTFTNIGKEKIFKAGKPSVVTDFIAEQDQQVYEIQPAHVNRVTINGKKVKPTEMGITSDGKVEIKKQINAGDVVVFYTDREIENIIDNMTRNVMRMTMNGLRQYAATRIVQEYATRNEKDKIMTFPKAEPENGRFNFIVDGKRVVIEIKDPLVAEAISGMETLGLTMWKPLAAAANLTRRAITLSGTFQLKQVFKDAPTAALVTGVKRPDLLVGGVFKGFVTSLTNSDPAVQILRAAGIGGFHSPARTPEAEVKRQIGVINKNSYDYVIGALDHFGDSSDMAQRVATYKRVMAETGNEAQALYQAANVINFMRHGSGQVAQIVTKTVPFMNAYAQSIDVLFQSLAGGGLKGISRKRALARIGVTGSLLVGLTLLYCMAVGDDEEYQLLDDQSKLRSYVIPGTKIVLPMNTSAAYFFKAIPEMIYNYVMKNGTEKPMDEKRLRTGLKEAAIDMLLGPNPVPSAVKPFVEIALNKNFFTGETVIPRGMEKLETAQQYNASTSEAGKFLSSMTGGKEKRLLSPVEADHLIRSIFGTAGSMAQWASNVIGEAADARPAVVAKDYPFIGPFLRPEVPRGPEDLFYDFKEYTDKKMQTYNRLLERDRLDEAEEYLNKNEGLIAFSEYANETESSLKEINALIRMYGETTDKTLSPKEKRAEIENLQRIKNEILSNIEFIRKEAGL